MAFVGPALQHSDEGEMGDSVCSTLSDCSLLGECGPQRRLQRGRRQRSRRSNAAGQGDRPIGCFKADDAATDADAADFAVDDDASNNNDADDDDDDIDVSGSAGAAVQEESSTDGATYLSAVMRQFRGELDRLAASVTQRVTAGSHAGSRSPHGARDAGQLSASAPSTSVYSVVKSGCLSLLLSRVLPPLLERFEQRLIGRLETAGLLPAASSTDQRQHVPHRHRHQSPSSGDFCSPRRPVEAPPRTTTAPAPAPRPSQCQPPVLREFPPASPRQPPPQPPPRPPRLPPLPLPRHPRACQLSQASSQHRVASPYFAAHAATSIVAGPQTVRNNSSLKPPSPAAPSVQSRRQSSQQTPQPPRQPPPQPPPQPQNNDLVHTFLVRDSPSLRQILFDPDDRKMKSISQRYGCYISVIEKTRRAGHLLHKVVIRASSEKAMRMCINALDNGLNWDLASQLNRANSKKAAATAPSAYMAK